MTDVNDGHLNRWAFVKRCNKLNRKPAKQIYLSYNNID